MVDDQMVYSYKIYSKALKEIRKYKEEENDLIKILHQKLVRELDKTAGKDIYFLEENLKNYEKIKLGKKNSFRLIFKKEKKKNNIIVSLLFFEKTNDAKRNDSYAAFERWKKNYEKYPENYTFIPIKDFHLEDAKKFERFIENDYKYSIIPTPTQTEFIEKVPTHIPIVSYVKGVPGSGKTVLGQEVSVKAILHNMAVLVVVPNIKLVNYYREYLISNNVNRQKINPIDSSGVLQIIEGHVTIVSFRYLLRAILPNLSIENERIKAEKVFSRPQIRNFFDEFSSAQEILDFYNAFFDIGGRQIAEIEKDAISKEFKNKIRQLDREKYRIKKILNENNLRTRKEIAKLFFKTFNDVSKNPIALYVEGGKPLFIIIDEIQDFIYEEWNGFVNFALKNKAAKEPKVRLLFLGDEKQRITISGFSWTFFKNQIHNKVTHKEIELKDNFRVTKQIAKFVYLIDNLTQNNKERHVTSINEEDCKYSKGKVNILQGSLLTIENALSQLKSEINEGQKAIVITNDGSSENKNIELLKPYEAKGIEHENVFLLNPFKEFIEKSKITRRKKFYADENYKLYTMATRSKNALTVLLNKEEYQWFSEVYRKYELNDAIELHPTSVSSVMIVKKIIENIGLENISLENLIETLNNKIDFVVRHKRDVHLFNDLNEIILTAFQNPKSILEVVEILRDIDIFSFNSLNDLDESIESMENGSKKQKVILFWQLYNKEFVKASRKAKKISMKLYNEIKNITKNKYSKYLLYMYEQLDKTNSPYFPTDLHKEFFDYFNRNSNQKPENQIIFDFFKNKLVELNNRIEEVVK